MKFQEPEKKPPITEPATPDVPVVPNKPPKKEGDNDFTKEKPNDPTRQPNPTPGAPVKEPTPQKPNPQA